MNKEALRVYIGHDSREQAAYDVAANSAREFGCQVTPIYEDRLRASGILTRPLDRRGGMWDFNSNAPQSTDFAISRFAAPLLAHDGWVLGCDCDVVVLSDPHPILELCNPSKAVLVVKHQLMPSAKTKMVDQPQTVYPRKNWSSVILWNCDHEANRRLNLQMLNQWPGRDLHAFKWLHDSEIGELPPRWNWLVGLEPKPQDPVIAHFTEGGPWLENWEARDTDEIWLRASER